MLECLVLSNSPQKTFKNITLQLDESTDVSHDPQLLVYVMFQGTSDLMEEFLFCKPLIITTTGQDLFNMVDCFFKDEGLMWSQCFSICCDGAPAMLGTRKGFVAKVKEANQNVIVVHCLLHRENLASRHISSDLGAVMDNVVAVVNYIKAGPLNSRIFREICSDFESSHQHLLYHSEVRWLSRGKVLQRLIELHVQVQCFLTEKNHELAHKFSDVSWMLKVAYLADIFGELNCLNISMQGRNQTLISISEKLKAFKKKLTMWRAKVQANRNASFPYPVERRK